MTWTTGLIADLAHTGRRAGWNGVVGMVPSQRGPGLPHSQMLPEGLLDRDSQCFAAYCFLLGWWFLPLGSSWGTGMPLGRVKWVGWEQKVQFLLYAECYSSTPLPSAPPY